MYVCYVHVPLVFEELIHATFEGVKTLRGDEFCGPFGGECFAARGGCPIHMGYQVPPSANVLTCDV